MSEREEVMHVKGLIRCGYSAQEIADELGWNTSYPRDVLRRLRERGWDIPHGKKGRPKR